MSSYYESIFGNPANLKIEYVISHSFNPDGTDNIVWGNIDLTDVYTEVKISKLESKPTIGNQSGRKVMTNSNGIYLEFDLTFAVRNEDDANAISNMYRLFQEALNPDAPYFRFTPDITRVSSYVCHSIDLSNNGSYGYKFDATFQTVEKLLEMPIIPDNNTYYRATGSSGLDGTGLEAIAIPFVDLNQNIVTSYSPTNEKIYFLYPKISTGFTSIIGASNLEEINTFESLRIESIFGVDYYVYETINLLTLSNATYEFKRVI